MAGKAKSRRGPAGLNDVLTTVPAPATAVDKVLLEIRKFIAAAIFFNSKAAEEVGLSLTDMQMIHVLQLYGPATPSRLRAWTGLSSGGVTVALDRLEKVGCIRREPNPADRRSLLVTLAPVRMRKVAGIYAGVERQTRERLAALSERELEVVIRFFETLRAVRMEEDGVTRKG